MHAPLAYKIGNGAIGNACPWQAKRTSVKFNITCMITQLSERKPNIKSRKYGHGGIGSAS